MSRRACYVIGLFVLLALAGCGGGWFMERESWRHEAEVACLKSGQVKVGPAVAQLPAISGPGVCGADFPLKVSALGESAVLGFADELRPPAAIPPLGQTPRPVPAPPPSHGYPQPASPNAYPQRPYAAQPPAAQPAYPTQSGAPGAPMSLKPPGTEDDEAYAEPPAARSAPTYAGPGSVSRGAPLPPPSASPPSPRPYSMREGQYDPPRAQPPEPYYTPPLRTPPPGRYGAPRADPLPPLGPQAPALAGGPATVQPAATLACPMVSALDQWISASVQPAALRWFGQPVVEIRQISAYSCRGMNGSPRASISEHAFGNALDIASFTLADGRKVTVRDGWRGLPEERGFLHDVHAAACQQFSTVLGPGSNIYHYDHLHLDLMRRSSGRAICNPAALPGDAIAGRRGEPLVTGSGGNRTPLGFSADARGRSLPHAVAGED